MLDLSAGPVTVNDNTAGASNYFTSCYGSSAPDHVFGFTASVAGTYTFSTCNYYAYDTSLKVWTDCLGEGFGSQLACVDDSCGVGSSISLYLSTPGTYFVVVDGYSSGSGAYTLVVSPPMGG
jgi:hypothetical protein